MSYKKKKREDKERVINLTVHRYIIILNSKKKYQKDMNYRNPELVPVPVFPWSLAPPHSLWWSPGKTCSWQSDWCWWRCRHWPSQRQHTSCPASPSSWSDQTWSLVSEWQQPGRCFCLSCHCWEDRIITRVSKSEWKWFCRDWNHIYVKLFWAVHISLKNRGVIHYLL